MNSLHAIKAFAACTIVAMVFAGCSEDQTSLDVNNVPGRAKIIGSLTYSEGTILVDGQFKELIKPAANKEVVFTIPNSIYTGNEENQGNAVFKTITDANGRYEIEIPASIVEATPISINPADFTGYFKYVLLENNTTRIDSSLVVYRYSNYSENNSQVHQNEEANISNATATLYPNQICFADLRYEEVDYQDIENEYTQHVNLNGKIGKGLKERHRPIVTKDEEGNDILIKNAEVIPYFDKSPNTDLIIGITYNSQTRYYNLSTGSDGEFSLNIPVKDIQCELSYEIHALPFAATFTDYEITYDVPEDAVYSFDYKEIPNIKGYYAEDNSAINGENHEATVSGNLIYTVKEQSHRIEAKMMIFYPYDDPHEFNQTIWDNAEWFEDIER